MIPALLMNVVADEIDGHAVALQHHDQVRERFPAVGDEVRGAFQRDGQERRDRLGVTDDRRRRAARRVCFELRGRARLLQRRQP